MKLPRGKAQYRDIAKKINFFPKSSFNFAGFFGRLLWTQGIILHRRTSPYLILRRFWADLKISIFWPKWHFRDGRKFSRSWFWPEISTKTFLDKIFKWEVAKHIGAPYAPRFSFVWPKQRYLIFLAKWSFWHIFGQFLRNEVEISGRQHLRKFYR